MKEPEKDPEKKDEKKDETKDETKEKDEKPAAEKGTEGDAAMDEGADKPADAGAEEAKANDTAEKMDTAEEAKPVKKVAPKKRYKRIELKVEQTVYGAMPEKELQVCPRSQKIVIDNEISTYQRTPHTHTGLLREGGPNGRDRQGHRGTERGAQHAGELCSGNALQN